MAAQRPSDLRARLGKAVGSGGANRAATTTSDTAPTPASEDIDTRPAAQRRGSRKQQQGINWDVDLLEYSRDVVARMSRAYPHESGAASLAALVDTAVRAQITSWEKRFNTGKAFPPLV